jgi:dihydroxyacetone synthase
MAPSAVESVSHLPLKVVPSKNGAYDGLVNLEFEGSDLHNHVLKSFRCLIADLCEQFNGGHPGGAMGMAAIGVALWRYTMKYSPENPNFFNRDRFVLSNGKPRKRGPSVQMLINSRPHMSVSIHLPPSCRIQEHDL